MKATVLFVLLFSVNALACDDEIDCPVYAVCHKNKDMKKGVCIPDKTKERDELARRALLKKEDDRTEEEIKERNPDDLRTTDIKPGKKCRLDTQCQLGDLCFKEPETKYGVCQCGFKELCQR